MLQGSVLGPVLFVIFKNDLPYEVKQSVHILTHQNDTKMWSKISNRQDCVYFQEDIDNQTDYQDKISENNLEETNECCF